MLGGTGLHLVTLGGQPHIHNGMMEQWVVGPPDIWRFQNVKFDITRRVEFRQIKRTAAVNAINNEASFPEVYDIANDDDADNTANFEYGPITGGQLFAVDGPGQQLPSIAEPSDEYVFGANFESFVRVRFDGIKPGGAGISGSRASHKLLWHSNYQIITANGTWTIADVPQSSIGQDHVPLPTF